MPAAGATPVRRFGSPPPWLAGLAIVFVTVIAYRGSFTAPFVFDDLPGIVRNATIRQLWPLDNVLLPAQASGTGVVGRPIVNLSLALNFAVGGLDVRGYHAVNLLVHLATTLLLFAVVRRACERWHSAPVPAGFSAAPWPVRPEAVGSLSLAFVTALLWAVHPLQTESVVCVIQRTELLVGFFIF